MQEQSTSAKNRSGLDLKFPPLSKTVREVGRLVRSSTRDTEELAAVIAADPMMAASVLRRVNSAFYGVRRQVADLSKAVFMLGFEDVSNLVLTASFLKLADVVKTQGARNLFGDLMQLSLGSALYGRLIASELDLDSAETAYSAGLMHTSGRVVLLFNFAEKYATLCRPGTERVFPEASLERTVIGIDHAQAGGLALTEWQMPSDLVQIVSCLEAPGRLNDAVLRDLALCVSVGVSATEQLCLRKASSLAFEAKAALHVLARMRGKSASVITERINESKSEINEQIARLAGDLSLA
jgi:HD-like signal output (HDOD) protein